MSDDALFDGATLRDQGIAKVLFNTPYDYERAFVKQFNRLLRAGDSFTSENVVAVVGYPPNHHNAIGALMSRCVASAKRANVIEVQGWRSTDHREGHARAVRVYARSASADALLDLPGGDDDA